jgi:hypothetical protein
LATAYYVRDCSGKHGEGFVRWGCAGSRRKDQDKYCSG